MQIFSTLINPDKRPLALTIGNFDGVHIGHQAIVNTLVQTAKQQNYHPAAMTFAPHAKVFFAQETNFLISSATEKADYMAAHGIEWLYQLAFNRTFSEISAESFVQQLIDDLNVRYLLVGDDFRFGYQGRGNFQLLAKLCEQQGVAVQHTPTIRYGKHRVSSSRVRQAIKAADFALVAALLGRDLAYRGKVISGKQLGRRLNFPTANIRLPHTRLLPDGVFAVRVTVDGKTYGGMCNIGTKPTVDSSNTRQIETHLFDFSDDLYGKTITVELLAKIRDEQKFAGVDKLVAQLAQDKMVAMDILQQQR